MVILMDLKKCGIRCLLYMCTVFLLLSGCSKIDSVPTSPSATTTTFTATVNVANVTNLFGVDFDLQYDKTVFSKTSIANGSFLAEPVEALYGDEPDSLTGNFTVSVMRMADAGAHTGRSGSGTLCTITFSTTSTGTKDITIVPGSIKLYDTTGNMTLGSSSSVTITVN